MTDQYLKWLEDGERGLSSECLMRHLHGSRQIATDYPYDADDLARCRFALEQTGTLGRIKEAATISPVWAGIVEKWDLLCSVMDKSVPDWRTGGSRWSNAVYELLSAIEKKARDGQ